MLVGSFGPGVDGLLVDDDSADTEFPVPVDDPTVVATLNHDADARRAIVRQVAIVGELVGIAGAEFSGALDVRGRHAGASLAGEMKTDRELYRGAEPKLDDVRPYRVEGGHPAQLLCLIGGTQRDARVAALVAFVAGGLHDHPAWRAAIFAEGFECLLDG